MERGGEKNRVLTHGDGHPFACTLDELSCIVGNLFAGLEVPCDLLHGKDCLTICGETNSGKWAALEIYNTHCCFYGDESDLAAIRGRTCLEGRCGRGRQ